MHHYIAKIVGGLCRENDWSDNRWTRGWVTAPWQQWWNGNETIFNDLNIIRSSNNHSYWNTGTPALHNLVNLCTWVTFLTQVNFFNACQFFNMLMRYINSLTCSCIQ